MLPWGFRLLLWMSVRSSRDGREGGEGGHWKQDSRALRMGGSSKKIQNKRSGVHAGNKCSHVRKSRAKACMTMPRHYIGL